MRINDLKSGRKMFFACLLVFAALVYFGNQSTPPVTLKGIVAGVLEQEGITRAVAMDVDGERYVVRYTAEFLSLHAPPALKKNQEVEIAATKFKAVKQGVTCEFVSLVKAGPVREDLAPKGDEALPVDDLKSSLGFKGM